MYPRVTVRVAGCVRGDGFPADSGASGPLGWADIPARCFFLFLPLILAYLGGGSPEEMEEEEEKLTDIQLSSLPHPPTRTSPSTSFGRYNIPLFL